MSVLCLFQARPHIRAQQPLDLLVRECAATSRYVPPLIQRIKQLQGAKDAGQQFRAVSREEFQFVPTNPIFQQVGLIYDSQALVDPATRLVDISRSSVSHVGDKHSAGLLLQNSQQLSVRSDELKGMIDLAKSDSNSFRSMWPNCARC